ncbi:MAG: xanthine phosphoribosyltransferase, partial [Alphaproteobacteria bacterium]|nr:xanthine phosphoribosyltransferase [Alphaproteobacteria bacterium]
MSDENPNLKPFPVTWDELHRYSKALAWRLHGALPEGTQWKGIIAVTRGGLVPAGIIARELEIRVVETICISSYDHQKQRKAEMLKPVMQAVG